MRCRKFEIYFKYLFEDYAQEIDRYIKSNQNTHQTQTVSGNSITYKPLLVSLVRQLGTTCNFEDVRRLTSAVKRRARRSTGLGAVCGYRRWPESCLHKLCVWSLYTVCTWPAVLVPGNLHGSLDFTKCVGQGSTAV